MPYNSTILRSRSRGVSWPRFALRLFCILLAMVLCGYLLMCLVYCLPTDVIAANVKQSADVFRPDGTLIHLSGNRDGVLDSATDVIMLFTAVTPTEEPFYIQALKNERYYQEEFPCITFSQVFQKEVPASGTTSYARYWHGYLLWLKPLLTIMNYRYLIYLNMLVQLGLFLYLCYLYIQNGHTGYCLSLIVLWFFYNPVSLMLSMQYISVWVTLLIQLIWLEKTWPKPEPSRLMTAEGEPEDRCRTLMLFFMVSGALINYFDFLTYPLATLGIPLAMVISQEKVDWKRGLFDVFWYTLLWGIGYSGIWISKWLLANLLTNLDVIRDALMEAEIRSKSFADNAHLPYSKVVINTLMGLNPVFLIGFVLFSVRLVVKALKKGKIDLSAAVPYAVLCVYPFVWFAVFANHTYLESIFSFRNLGIALYAFLLFLFWQRERLSPSLPQEHT